MSDNTCPFPYCKCEDSFQSGIKKRNLDTLSEVVEMLEGMKMGPDQWSDEWEYTHDRVLKDAIQKVKGMVENAD
jgi:hypothetical protein